MNPSLTVQHALGTYPVYIAPGLLNQSGKLLANHLDPSSLDFAVVDENVATYFEGIASSLQAARLPKPAPVRYQLKPGEPSKSAEEAQTIWSAMLKSGIDRSSSVIAVGGGVTGDLAGFVAATYMRGLRFIQVPTTLLAQVDSSVGGKTGINLPLAKNSVGSFWQPQAVLIDPLVLTTLADSQYTSGLAEVVKYGVIMDEEFFTFLETNVTAINQKDMPALTSLIRRCCELKAQVVAEDERETSGRRAILNYGHTFGHAIESVFGYGTWLHGHAVALGMHAAAHLARQLGRVDDGFINRQHHLLTALNIETGFPKDEHTALYEAMQHDKKAVGGDIRFVLPDRIGNVELVGNVEKDLVLKAMANAANG